MSPSPLFVQAELTDGRLRLRPWRTADAAALVTAAHESLETVGRWLPWCCPEYSLTDAKSWINHGDASQGSSEGFAFGVFDAATAELLGGVGLSQCDFIHRSANLGYWVRQSQQGRGIAVAAARLAACFGFAQLELARIEIVALPENTASRATAERLGARFETITRKRLWVSGQALDAAVYGLIRRDLHCVKSPAGQTDAD